MIPVLGVPVLNRPDLLWGMLHSIDVEVGRLVVVDNGGIVTAEEAAKARVHLIQPGHNLGVSASWNLIIKSRPLAPWWAIVNSDVVFSPGGLAAMTELVESAGGWVFLDDPSSFAITTETIKTVGLFDENFVPGYFEDNDYQRRCELMGVQTASIRSGRVHLTSSTINSDEHLHRENRRTFAANADYYRRKWGGMPRSEVFTTPFNAGGSPAHWSLDFARLADLTWR